MNHKEFVLDYITQNKDVLKEKINPYVETRDRVLKTESFIFHDEIRTQCYDIARWLISQELCKDGSLTVEDCMIVLGDIGIENVYPDLFPKKET